METSNPNLRAKTKPLATLDLKLSNPNRINLKPTKMESTSDSLLSSFSWGVGFERTRERGKERQRGWGCVGFNEKEMMKD